MEERKVFNFVHKCSRDYIKGLGCKILWNIKLIYIYITSGVGVGKSHLIKSTHISLSKVLMYEGGDP